ncbi:hypothetical protein RJ640_025059 [Escallonia rubra]|uniref:Uncharacterized protein n=1 Tax=Escallonia rubra TaxID=112253 RepID=A0AA88QU14_9ASTE|nr:hypothetical protein RJ640_025059 [Escallonia rubra]
MEDCNTEKDRKKRVRDDSGPDSPESEPKRNRVEHDSPESELDDCTGPEKIAYHILDILEDADTVTEVPDLDSVIRSFEEEILHPSPAPASASDSSELGYLLEASDDELGLPPPASPSDEQPRSELSDLARIPCEAFGSGQILEYEDDAPGYDSFEFGFGFGDETESNNDGADGEFVALGGLFDYSETSDFSEFSWQPESLPAVVNFEYTLHFQFELVPNGRSVDMILSFVDVKNLLKAAEVPNGMSVDKIYSFVDVKNLLKAA